MTKGISIGIASDTREFATGVAKGVLKPLEDAAEALDDVAKGGDKAGDKLEAGMDQARSATSDFKREQSELAKAMTAANKTGRKIGTDVKAGTDEASEGVRDLKGEAAQSARETAASFDGSADSIAGMFQEVSANAFAGFGPAGMAAGLVAAAGIGLALAAIQDGIEGAEQYKDDVHELANEFVTTGKVGSAGLDFLVSKLQDMATTTEDGATNLAGLKKISDAAGGKSFKDLATAYGNNVGKLKELWRESDHAADSLDRQAGGVNTLNRENDGLYGSLMKQAAAQDKVTAYLGQQIGIAEKAAEAQRLYAEAGGPALELKAAAIESIQGAIDDTAGSWDDYRNTETQALDPAAFLAALQAKMAAADAYAGNLQTAQSKLSPAAYQYLVDQGIDFAPMLQSILDSGLTGQFDATFSAAAQAGNAAIDKNLKTDATIDVTAKVETSERDLNRVANAQRGARIDATAQIGQAERDLNRVANAQRTAHIDAVARGADAVDAAIAKMARDRTVTIRANVVDRNGRPII